MGNQELILLSHLKKLVRKRDFSRAHIDVISTSVGRTIWSGTPSDLKRKPQRSLALINRIKAVSENCNNLPGAFVELTSNLAALEREGFTKAHVIVFSSLIHTPRPCDQTTQIILPQAPPLEANINGALSFSKILRSINFYWVSPHQKNVWEEFLEPTFMAASLNKISIRFMDIERSKFSLEQRLNLEVRNFSLFTGSGLKYLSH